MDGGYCIPVRTAWWKILFMKCIESAGFVLNQEKITKASCSSNEQCRSSRLEREWGFGLHGFDIPINIDSICDKKNSKGMCSPFVLYDQ